MSVLIDITTMHAEAIAQSDTTEFDPPLKMLQVFAINGNIKVLPANVPDESANRVTYVIPDAAGGAGCPFTIPGLIRKIYSTDTTIADAAMIGYR